MTTGLEFVDKVRVYQVQRDSWYAAIEQYNWMKRNGASRDALSVQMTVMDEAMVKTQLLASNIADCAVGMIAASDVGAALGKVGAR